MKPVLFALALLTAAPALAGGLPEPAPRPAPVMAPATVAEQAGSSAQGIVVPLLLLVVIAAALAD